MDNDITAPPLDKQPLGLALQREVRPDVHHVMGAVWNLYQHGPNFDGRQRYVENAIEAAIDRAVATERERCAVAAWNHYMDHCRRKHIAPVMMEEWCAAAAVRRA